VPLPHPADARGAHTGCRSQRARAPVRGPRWCRLRGQANDFLGIDLAHRRFSKKWLKKGDDRILEQQLEEYWTAGPKAEDDVDVTTVSPQSPAAS